MAKNNKRYLVLFPFSFKERTSFIIENFFKDTNDFSSVLHLTSRWTRIEDFRTRLFLCKKRPIIPPESFSLKGFAGKIVQEQTNYRLISSIEQFLMILELCQQMAEKLSINPVSLATRLKSFIKDFKVSCENFDFSIWNDEIEKFPWRYEQNKETVKLAVEVMQNYQNHLEKNFLVDEDDLYRVAAAQIEKMKFDTVILEGILEFIPSQRRLVEKIAENSELFIVVYQFDEKAPFDSKKYILEPNLDFLKSITDEAIKIKDERQTEDCVVYNFSSPDEEIKGIGEMIVKKISENGIINWEDFLVVFPEMLSYRELVQRIFTRLNIPFCMTPGYVLSQDPSIVAIISFLKWLDYEYSWENLMSLFTSPFFSFDFNETIEFSRETREKFKGIGFFPEIVWLRRWKNWKKLEKARSIMEVKQDSLTGWTNRLVKALEKIGWKEFDTEGRYAFFELLDGLKGEIELDRQSFVHLFNEVLELKEVEQSKGTGVKIMGILDSTGIETDFCFLGGATDDALPQVASSEEFFIPDRLKEILKLNTFDLKLARERLDVYRLKSSHKKIIFTYPSKVSGRHRARSIMLYGLNEEPFHEPVYISCSDTIFSIKPNIEKFRKKFIKDGKLHFTVSQIDKIARCPFDFYLTYVEELEPYTSPEIEELPEFWGILLHWAAEKASVDFRTKIMDEDCIQKQFTDFCNYVNKALEDPSIVTNNNFYKIPPVIKFFLEKRKNAVFASFKSALEKHKNHKILEIEKSMTVRFENMVITGKMDRIEETSNGEVEIIDFKSGRPPTIRKKYPDKGNFFELGNLELPLYALIYYKETGKKSKVFVWSLNFDENDFEKEYPGISEFLEDFEQDLNTFAKKLIDNEFDFTVKGKNCFGCSFSRYCIIRGEDSE